MHYTFKKKKIAFQVEPKLVFYTNISKEFEANYYHNLLTSEGSN